MKKILVCISLLLFLSGCSVCAHTVAGDCMTEKDKILGRQYKARIEAGEFTNNKNESK